MKKIYEKYKEMIKYVFFGGCTTLVNFAVYFLAKDLFNIHYLISNVIAWIFAVVFAYFTNRYFVFEERAYGIKSIVFEFLLFCGARILSLGIDSLTMYVFVDLFAINDKISKIIANVFVVIINYVLSKLVIFKNRN